MNESLQTLDSIPPALRVAAGEDRFGEHRGLGISSIDFKASTQDGGGLFILENTFREKGGPARQFSDGRKAHLMPMRGKVMSTVAGGRVEKEAKNGFTSCI